MRLGTKRGEHRAGFTKSVTAFHFYILRYSPAGGKAGYTNSNRAAGVSWTHTEMPIPLISHAYLQKLSDLSKVPTVPLSAAVLVSTLPSSSFAPETTPQHPLTVCDAFASSLTKRINLPPWACPLVEKDASSRRVFSGCRHLPRRSLERGVPEMKARFLWMSFVRASMPSLPALERGERKQKPVQVGSAKHTEGASVIRNQGFLDCVLLQRSRGEDVDESIELSRTGPWGSQSRFLSGWMQGRDPSRVGVKASCLSGVVESTARISSASLSSLLLAVLYWIKGRPWKVALAVLVPEMV